MTAFGISDKGPVRDMNEDSFAYQMVGNCLCMAVADGVGGEACGEIASRIAVESCMEEFKDSLPFVKDREALPSYLKTVFNKGQHQDPSRLSGAQGAHGNVHDTYRSSFKGTELTIAHIGDTRGYHASRIRAHQAYRRPQ